MQIKIWDLPLRLFHWLLVVGIGAAWLTAEMAEDLGDNVIAIHGKIGLFILGLVSFRLVWGFVGSTHARFANFFPTPARLKAYLSGQAHPAGHNPLGAFSVFALLGLVLLQATSGLFANDDIDFHGPLFPLVTGALSDLLTKVHHLTFDALTVLIALHLGAIAFYLRFRKINLVKPMLTGHKEAKREDAAQGGGWGALIVALAIALGVVYLASGALIAPPPVAVTPPASNW